MNPLSFQSIDLSGLVSLQELATQTFIETFSAVNTPENMRLYQEQNLSLDQLRKELETENTRFYFAQQEEKKVAYLKLNLKQAMPCSSTETGLEIERIYVLKDFQKLGYGLQLFNKALEVAKEDDAKLIWLGVWEKNTKAIDFYKARGMTIVGQHVFKLGDDPQNDYIMKLNLI